MLVLNSLEESSDAKPKAFGINFENTSIHSVKDIVNSYKDHINIIKIKQVVNGSEISDKKRFCLKTANETEIKTLLRNLGIRKTSDVDAIPP